jgi:uncharacterized protein YndB with AHSA1/START domain
MKLALLIVIAVLIVTVLAVLAIGSSLPKEHEVTRSIDVAASPQEVFRTIADFDAAPQWRPGLKRVALLPSVDGRRRFREHTGDGITTYEVVEEVAAERLVTRITDLDLGYSGSWTYALEPAGAGTRVRITEHGVVTNVFFRFMSRFVFGHTKTIDNYLAALAARCSRQA